MEKTIIMIGPPVYLTPSLATLGSQARQRWAGVRFPHGLLHLLTLTLRGDVIIWQIDCTREGGSYAII